MKSLPKLNFAHLLFRLISAISCITAKQHSCILPAYAVKQRGVVLFLTLLALLAMSLAAVALIRSVDTAGMIAGNLAFQQAATAAGSTEIEQGIAWLAAQDSGIAVKTDPANILNTDPPGTGYYSFIDNTDLTDPAQFDWIARGSPPAVDANHNTKRFVIQRVCRLDNTPIDSNECLFAPTASTGSNSSQAVIGYDEVSETPPSSDGTVQYRITVRTEGPKNTHSYVQAFVY
ncbi:MAG: hypothetical protein KKH12_12860 [Gammaproteobacteria bacterium]|nr:hypothetical protein [Gammaproteobacteria bacterium]MBU1482546.1 hypothetical protein [Gammaproteobacteria bacterium]